MASYAEVKSVVLARLNAWANSLPQSERNMPRLVIDRVPYSPLDVVAQVTNDTPVGRNYVYQQAKALGYTIE